MAFGKIFMTLPTKLCYGSPPACVGVDSSLMFQSSTTDGTIYGSLGHYENEMLDGVFEEGFFFWELQNK